MEDMANVLFLWRLDSTLTYKDHKYRQGHLVGVSAEYPEITNTSVREGRFITEADDTHKREVIVIGPNVADALFPNYKQDRGNDRHDGRPSVRDHRCAGKAQEHVLWRKRRRQLAASFPSKQGASCLPSSDDMMLQIRAKSGMLDKALDQVEAVLRHRRGLKYNQPNDFDLQTATRIIEQFDNITMYVGLLPSRYPLSVCWSAASA